MSQKIVGVTVGTPIRPDSMRDKMNAVTAVNGIAPDESGNVNIEVNDKETDAKFFDITLDGIVSLKAVYRGHPTNNTYEHSVSDNGIKADGSQIDDLPEKIVIPEIINNIYVTGFQDGMFHWNFKVKEIVLPSTVSAIPVCFAANARYLRTIRNTERIASIGYRAFRQTRIDKALFPSLREVGTEAFTQSKLLCFADIGDYITKIPDKLFASCGKLRTVNGGASVNEIGVQSFYNTTSLHALPLLGKVTKLADKAFVHSRIQYDWSGKTVGTQSTPIQDNAVDFWTDAKFEVKENELNTLLCQFDPEWANEQFGYYSDAQNKDVKYNSACLFFCLMHIHSALTGERYQSPYDFREKFSESTLTTKTPRVLSNIKNYYAAELGYTEENGTLISMTGINTKESYEQLCKAINEGGYAIVDISTTSSVDGGHAVVIYGINEHGEMMIADSDTGSDMVEIYDDLFTYAMPFQNFTSPNSDILIIKKQA